MPHISRVTRIDLQTHIWVGLISDAGELAIPGYKRIYLERGAVNFEGQIKMSFPIHINLPEDMIAAVGLWDAPVGGKLIHSLPYVTISPAIPAGRLLTIGFYIRFRPVQ